MTSDASDRDVWTVSRREAMKGVGVVGATAIGSQAAVSRVMAQSGGPDHEISGTVTDESGSVEGATVVAVPHDESLDPLATTADGNGDYIFDVDALHTGENLYHVITRDGTESSPRRGQENYPFIAADGTIPIPDSENLHSQYVADSLSASNQDTIQSWTDGSDNGFDLSGGDPQLLSNEINGYPTVRFDGTADVLDVGFTALSQPYTIAHVLRMYDDSNTNEYLSGSVQGSGTYSFLRYRTQSAAAGEGFNYHAGSDLDEDSASALNTFHIIVNRVDGSDSVMDINGSEADSGDLGTNDLIGYSLGAREDGSFGHVDITESVVWDAGHDSTTRSEVAQYLNDKYGVF